MELTTQCPECGATFDASLEELQLRKGYIRCINCAYIFDGYEAVVSTSVHSAGHSTDEPEPSHSASDSRSPEFKAHEPDAFSVSSIATPMASPRERRMAQIRGRHSQRSVELPSDVDHSYSSAPPIRRGRRQSEPIITLADISAKPVPVSDVNHGPASIYVEPRYPDDEPPLPGFLDDEESTGAGGIARLFWGVLLGLGLLAVAAQLAYVYRVQIASEMPVLRPALEQACERLGCEVDYPRRIQQIAIIDSSLKALPEQDADSGHDMVLNVLLRNNYDKPQQWPTLTLDLVDFSGAVIVRRNLAPADYLTPEALQSPFEARSEVQMALPISVNSLQISGYQLGKHFP